MSNIFENMRVVDASKIPMDELAKIGQFNQRLVVKSLQSNQMLQIGPSDCVFCGRADDDPDALKTGRILSLAPRPFAIHELCLEAAANLMPDSESDGPLHGFRLPKILIEFRRGCKLTCDFCKKRGAVIGCDVASCKGKFHLPCGRENGTTHEFSGVGGINRSFCLKHRLSPPQLRGDDDADRLKGLSRLRDAITARPPTGLRALSVCGVCDEPVQRRAVRAAIVRTNCCTDFKRAHRPPLEHFYHYDCIQRTAANSGRYLRCPMTLMATDDFVHADLFTKQIQLAGVYWPEHREVSWQSQDLIESEPKRCSAVTCRCPEGMQFAEETADDHKNVPWELLNDCRGCGKVTHRECAGQPWAHYGAEPPSEPPWVCDDCVGHRDFLNQFEGAASQPHRTLTLSADTSAPRNAPVAVDSRETISLSADSDLEEDVLMQSVEEAPVQRLPMTEARVSRSMSSGANTSTPSSRGLAKENSPARPALKRSRTAEPEAARLFGPLVTTSTPNRYTRKLTEPQPVIDLTND